MYLKWSSVKTREKVRWGRPLTALPFTAHTKWHSWADTMAVQISDVSYPIWAELKEMEKKRNENVG